MPPRPDTAARRTPWRFVDAVLQAYAARGLSPAGALQVVDFLVQRSRTSR